MQLDIKIPVNATKEAIWDVISDYEHMVENISAITKVDILERPSSPDSLVGLKWTETRTMFGSEAVETMWVTQSEKPNYYETRAESHGAIYISRMYTASEVHSGVTTNYVGMKFNGQAESLCSKFMMTVMGWMFVGATKSALEKDLQDIKAIAEKKSTGKSTS